MRVAHLIRKPIDQPSVAKNVLVHGTGAINIDESRVGFQGDGASEDGTLTPYAQRRLQNARKGRYPKGLVLIHRPDCKPENCVPGCPVRELDEQSLAGGMHTAGNKKPSRTCSRFVLYGDSWDVTVENPDYYGDTGGASRFFKQVKP